MEIKKFTKKGFTLIEILVVVLIIGILAAIAVPQYQKATLKSRTIQARATLASLKEAQEAFYMTNMHYTTNIKELDINIDENLIFTDTPDENRPNQYMFRCPNSGQGCQAKAANVNLPHLEYHGGETIKGYPKGHENKFWCFTNGNKTDLAEEICKELSNGTIDTSMRDYAKPYYLINAN